MKRHSMFRISAILVGVTLLSACSDSSSSGVTLSGTLSGSLRDFSFKTLVNSLVKDHTFRTGVATTVSCATAENPPQVVTGAVDGSGNFDVDLSEVVGKGVTCTVLDSASNVLGTFLYENSQEKSFSGDSKKIDTVPFESSKDLGTVSVAGGQITVDADNLGIDTAGETVSAATAFDPTGSWTIGSAADTLPAGYIGACAVGSPSCHGPTQGEKIFIKRTVGKKFTPDAACQSHVAAGTFDDATCNGTTGTEDAFVLSIWMSQNSFNACGNGVDKGALGFNEAQAKAYGYIDFSSDTSTVHNAFNYSSTVGPATITDGWKISTATAAWPLMNCKSVSSGGQTAWKCFDNSNHYSLSLGGGCTAVNGEPLQPDDWSNMKWANSTGCSSSTSTFDGKTLQSNSCTVPYWPGGVEANAINLTCQSTWGAFNVGTDTVFNGPVVPETILAEGALCSSLATGGDAGKELQQLQCYANYFWQNSNSFPATACLRQIRTDWGATTPADFVLNDGPGRPMNMALTEKATYLSNDVATFTQYESDFRGVQVKDSNGSSWVSCKTKSKNTITVTKANAAGTEMMIKFVSETSLEDTKTACEAVAADPVLAVQSLNLGEVRMLFKMTKDAFKPTKVANK